MRIEAFTASPDRAGRYKTVFSDGSVLRLYKQTVQDFGIFTGLELTEEEYQSLLSAAAEMSAKMRAVRIVSASNVSKRELEHRLVQKGEDAASAKNAVSWMEEMDLLDDEKTAEMIVHRCAAKGYGIARAKQALYEKRIPKAYWESALENYPDQTEYIRTYIADHLPSQPDPKAVKKVIDALLRKGHSYGDVRHVLQCGEELEEY